MKKNLLVLLFFAFVMQAKAGVLIEPYVGYAFNGEFEVANTDSDYTGTTIGGRLGWQQLGLFGGLDYRMSNFEDEDGDELESSVYGLVVGYEFPILVRVWGEYILGGEGKDDETSNELKEVSGTILGVGYTGLPFVSLNLEMANYEYEEIENVEIDSEFSHILLSVSLPLNL